MSSERNYSRLDRLIHRLAFSTSTMQLAAADVEDTLYGKAFRGVVVERPIFVTSLPRAGTTLLLEFLSRVSGNASHCYRDMPFVLAPYLWTTLSRGFRKRAVAAERTHGDGMRVSYDSPEAFEETVWRAFWPAHYASDRIRPWSADERSAEFESFVRDHMRKIIALRVMRPPDQPSRGRYVSKNNANVARIGLLRRLFPDCSILVPFREPFDHAASMHHQHLRFTEVHVREPFSKRYMADIGHYEFGELHRPIDFPGFRDVRDRYGPDRLEYWIGYWVAAFEEILRAAPDIVLLSYERMCGGGAPALHALEQALHLTEGALVQAAGSSLRPPRTYDVLADVQDGELVERATGLRDRLLEQSIV